MRDIYIGVDGGATKSKVRIEDADGNVLGQAINGPSNIRLSVEGTWQAILQAINEALAQANLSLQHKNNYAFHAGMGLAGCEVKEAYEEFLQYPHPFDSLQVTTDAHVACIGAHQGQDGAIIVVGTGVVGYQIEQGQGTKVSGWGFPHDDIGGGAWLGLEASRLTFQWLDHRTEKSPLVTDVFSFFNNDLDRFVTWANRANSSEFARLAPLVINHSQQEEIVAVRLMKKAAHAIDHVGTALRKSQKRNEALPCVLFGGIAPFIEPWLGEPLRSRLVPRQADANAGAIILIKNFIARREKV